MLEMSNELEPYKGQIIDHLNITALDRPKWFIGESHYRVDKEYVKENIFDYLAYDNLDQNTLNFIKQYLPEVYQEVRGNSIND